MHGIEKCLPIFYRHRANKPVYCVAVHVAEQAAVGEGRDEEAEMGYLEALEKETSILQKRVNACKSRIMMITCFDILTTEV